MKEVLSNPESQKEDIDKLIERMDQNQDIFEKILEDQSFGRLVKELMMEKVYARMNEVAS